MYENTSFPGSFWGKNRLQGRDGLDRLSERSNLGGEELLNGRPSFYLIFVGVDVFLFLLISCFLFFNLGAFFLVFATFWSENLYSVECVEFWS